MDNPLLDPPQDSLEGAVARLNAVRKARRNAIIAAVVGFSGALVYLLAYADSETVAYGTQIAFVFAIAVYAAAFHLIARIEKLGPVRVFPRRARKIPLESFTAEAVPRLPGITTPSKAVILASDPVEHSASTVILTYACKGSHQATSLDASSFPEGALVLLSHGLVFLPAAGSIAREVFQGVGTSIFNVAKLSLSFLSVLGAAGLDHLLTPKEAALPQWLRKSMQHPHHFVVPWVEIVAVRTRPSGISGREVEVRVLCEQDSGDRPEYRFISPELKWPQALMQFRLLGDYLAALHEKIRGPEAEALLPGLRKEFEALYGDRVEEHAFDIAEELHARLDTHFETIPQDEMARRFRQALAPVLPYYMKIPNIVKNQPWLFEDEAPETHA